MKDDIEKQKVSQLKKELKDKLISESDIPEPPKKTKKVKESKKVRENITEEVPRVITF